MKGIVYRSAALALALVVVCSALAVPSFATDYQSTYNFWNWAYDNSWFLGKAIIGFSAGNVCQVSEDGMHHATTHSGGGGSVDGQRVYKCVCDLCGQEFQAVATDLQYTYNDTVYNNKYNGVSSDNRVYLNLFWVVDDASVTYVDANTWHKFKSDPLFDTGILYPYATVKVDVSSKLYVAEYRRFRSSLWSETISSHSFAVELYSPVSDEYYTNWVDIFDGRYQEFQLQPDVEYKLCCSSIQSGWGGTATEQIYYFEWPDVFLIKDKSEVDIVRPDGFNPSFTYQDGDEWQVHTSGSLIDETNLTYYNPVTNTTTNITNWTYDYSDRSYTCTTENNTTTTITYGDEYITINEGDNITYNIYYYTEPDSSGDGSGSGSDGEGSGSGGSGDSSDDGDGIGGGLGELLGSLLGGLIDLITGLISGLIDSLINLVEMTIEKLGQVVNLFGEFGDALKVLWSWLPDEVVTILAAGVSVVVFASVIKLFV